MIAMVLAAGEGRRLGKITNATSKVLLKIRGRTILERNLLYLKKAGIKEVVINVCRHARKIRRLIQKNKSWGLRIHLSEEITPLGTAGGVKRAAHWLKNADFLLVYGDNLTNFNLKHMLRNHVRNKPMVTLGVYQTALTLSSGIAAGHVEVEDDCNVVRFKEMTGSLNAPSNVYVNAGVGVFSSRVLDWIPESGVSDFGKDVFPVLLKKKKTIKIFSGATYVLACDTVKTLRRTRQLAKKYKL